MFFADTICPQSVCGGLLAMLVSWWGWGKGLKSSCDIDGCMSAPFPMMPEHAELTCHPWCYSPEHCPDLLSSSQTPELLRTSDNGDCQAVWWSWWLWACGLQMLELRPCLLFSTARSSCIAHHGTCAKLYRGHGVTKITKIAKIVKFKAVSWRRWGFSFFLDILRSVIQQALGPVMEAEMDVVQASTDSSRLSLGGRVRPGLCF